MRAELAYEEERLGGLLRLLPPAPDACVRAAQELPATQRALAQILALAEADSEFRRELATDLEGAVRGAGHEPGAPLIRSVRDAIEERG